MRDGRSNAVPVLIAVFLALIGLAWAFGDPPGAGPDEPAHYVKALGAGGGDLRGRAPGGPTEAQIRALVNARRSPEQRRQLEAMLAVKPSRRAIWQQRASRVFTVPAGLSFSAFGCGYLGDHDWGRCLDQGTSSPTATYAPTYVGTYQPYAYVVPGLVMRAAGEPQTAMRLGRLANAALSLGLLALAALVLWDGARGALSLAGLAVAVTPVVVFFASLLNPSGPELAAAICFSACLLRLTRSAEQPGWVWAACAGSGAVLALSRSLGPIFVLLLLATVVVLTGWRRAATTARAAPRKAVATAAALAIACLAGAAWERAYQPHLSSGPGPILDGLDAAVDELPSMPKQAVGVFGGLDVYLPLTYYIVWWLMLAALVAAAIYASRGLERAALAGLAGAIVVGTLLLASVFSQTGGGMQARYILPLAVLLPLWAGEQLSRHRERLSPSAARGLIVATMGGAAVLHAAAWYENSREFSESWDPPLGWLTWIVAVLVGCGAYALAGWRAGQAAYP